MRVFENLKHTNNKQLFEVSYKLKSSFTKFNKTIFNNKIVLDFPLGLYDGGGNSFKLGQVNCNKDFKVIGLYINNKNNLPVEALDAVLIHEMIHVYSLQLHGGKALADDIGGHGKIFKKMRLDIMKKFPDLIIPVKEDMESILEIMDKLGKV